MIVKNESKIIKRCLNSCKSVIDYISICDTGSSDNTIEKIENFCKENNIVGKVHSHEWKNFGYNRTLSFQEAKKTFPDATYCFLVDADMTLKISSEFDKKLSAGCYSIAQNAGGLYYFNTRIIHTKYDWECVGVTHEYWSSQDANCTTQKLKTLEIEDIGDGGSKADKFERDIRLLKQGIIDEPNNARYYFYLGQSFHDIGKYDEAISWYRKRIKFGGWFEEVYYSYYRIALCKYKNDKTWNEVQSAFLDAFNYLPSRMEPLYEIGKHYQENEEYEEGYNWLINASKIPFPEKHILFLYKDIYEFKIWDSLSICAYYLGKYKDSIDYCLKALKSSYCDSRTAERIKNNMRFSIEALRQV